MINKYGNLGMISPHFLSLNSQHPFDPIYNPTLANVRPKMPELEQISENVNILKIMMSIETVSSRLSLPLIS